MFHDLEFPDWIQCEVPVLAAQQDVIVKHRRMEHRKLSSKKMNMTWRYNISSLEFLTGTMWNIRWIIGVSNCSNEEYSFDRWRIPIRAMKNIWWISSNKEKEDFGISIIWKYRSSTCIRRCYIFKLLRDVFCNR